MEVTSRDALLVPLLLLSVVYLLYNPPESRKQNEIKEKEKVYREVNRDGEFGREQPTHTRVAPYLYETCLTLGKDNKQLLACSAPKPPAKPPNPPAAAAQSSVCVSPRNLTTYRHLSTLSSLPKIPRIYGSPPTHAAAWVWLPLCPFVVRYHRDALKHFLSSLF